MLPRKARGAIPDRERGALGTVDAALILMRKIWLRELRAFPEVDH